MSESIGGDDGIWRGGCCGSVGEVLINEHLLLKKMRIIIILNACTVSAWLTADGLKVT